MTQQLTRTDSKDKLINAGIFSKADVDALLRIEKTTEEIRRSQIEKIFQS